MSEKKRGGGGGKADSPFDQIITLRDAQRCYKRARTTLMIQIDLGRIRAQKIGCHWFLMIDDLDHLYKRTNS